MFKEDELFKIGDLVQLGGTFSPERHPPRGTYGVVIDVEDWRDECRDSNSDIDDVIVVEQFVRVHWAHDLNGNEQCYADVSLKKVINA